VNGHPESAPRDGGESRPREGTQRVLVVEDDPNTREYIAAALRGADETYSVSTARNLQCAIDALTGEAPDAVLVDLGLPDGNGIDAIRFARERSDETRILVITVFGDEKSVVGAIEAGAQGYLLKGEAPADLREAVSQVLAGGAPISPGIAAHLLRRFNEIVSRRASETRACSLTQREHDVLTYMVKGLSYQEVANLLGVSRNTVASHVKSIYRKLEVSSRGEAAFEALTRGIVTVDPGV